MGMLTTGLVSYNLGVIYKLYSVLSLQSFKVSLARKLWLIFGLFALVAALYLQQHAVLRTYIDPNVLQLVIVFFTTYTFLSLIRFIMVTAYRSRMKVPVGERDNFIIGTDSTVRLIVVLVVAGSIFPIFGIPLGDFLTTLSVFSVALVWLFKEYLTNFIDSYRLLYSKDFLVGDYIKVGDYSKGIITDITFRATKLKTDSGDVMFIPNTTLLSSEVINYSKVRYKRIIVPFSVTTEKVENLANFELFIVDALQDAYPDLINPEKTFLRITNIENGHATCAFEIAIDTYSFSIEDKLTRSVYQAVLAFGRE